MSTRNSRASLAIVTNFGVRIVEPNSGELIDFRKCEKVKALAFSPDGSLVTGSGNVEEAKNSITFWDPCGKEVSNLDGKEGRINSIAWNPEGDVVAYGTMGGVGVWNPTAGKKVFVHLGLESGHTSEVNAVAWLDDEYFASGADDGKVCVWKRTDEKLECVKILEDEEHPRSPVVCLAWNHDLKCLAFASWNNILVWDIRKEIFTVRLKQTERVNSISWNDAYERIIFTRKDRVYALDPCSQQCRKIWEIPGPISVAWNPFVCKNPDGQLFAAKRGSEIEIRKTVLGRTSIFSVNSKWVGAMAWCA